ncbi:MAG: hypothetical protein Q8K58_05420 [Acidimicrobiales bacterium]|nr:hypothetical protein [Acidimicrobiales bacterium]
METYVVRMWLPDRPGALGQVASRIGAVRGEIVGIDILERGGGRAIDELVVDLPEAGLEDLLVQEIQQVDGVDVEEIRPVADALHDPRLDALETAAILVGATDRAELLESVVVHSRRVVGAAWSAVVDLADGTVVAAEGAVPAAGWLVAFVEGSQSSARVASGESGPADVAWSPLPSAGLALIVGRDGVGYRARERRQMAALARIVDTRMREIVRFRAMSNHPSSAR